jgi:hypothetical protein
MELFHIKQPEILWFQMSILTDLFQKDTALYHSYK